MRSRSFLMMFMFVLSLTMASCGGGGGGAPGSSDANETGILVQSALFLIESDDIDVYQSMTACDGEEEEPLTDANGTLRITASALNPDQNYSPFPAHIEKCMVTYTSQVIGAPVLESKTIYPNCGFINGTTECTVEIINIDRKHVFWDALVSQKFIPAEYPTNYTVEYKCEYQDAFRRNGKLGGRIDIDLADWLVCE
jgi:hypothetical protein